MYWEIVELVYLANVLIFAFLSIVFWRKYRRAVDGKNVLIPLSVLVTMLFLQELYFLFNTAMDPAKLNWLPQFFSFWSSLWIYAKIILTLAGAGIVYMVFRYK